MPSSFFFISSCSSSSSSLTAAPGDNISGSSGSLPLDRSSRKEQLNFGFAAPAKGIEDRVGPDSFSSSLCA
uniref:Putative secreted protein n=1 Tax=Anopheles marajoara TaxID=58244 RepID=A0A2M4CEF4_9DIPT